MSNLWHRVILGAALALILALVFTTRARPGTLSQVLPSGDTLFVAGATDSTHVWIGMRALAPGPKIISLTRVYPYLKPFGSEFGNEKARNYYGVGIGYDFGWFISASVEWRHIYGWGHEWAASVKLSLR